MTSQSHLSACAFVTVTPGGVRLERQVRAPLSGDPPSIDLGLRELQVLAAISRSGVVAVDPYDPLVEQLAERQLLSAAPAEQTVLPEFELETEPAPTLGLSDSYLLDIPLVLRVASGRFEVFDFRGRVRLRLDAARTNALPSFAAAGSLGDATVRHATAAGADALSERELRDLAGQLAAAGVLRAVDTELEARQRDRVTSVYRQALHSQQALVRVVHQRTAEEAVAEREREGRTRMRRMPVVPVLSSPWSLPLALGMIMASLREFGDHRLERVFDIQPRWLTEREGVPAAASRSGVFLFSNYVWDHGANLAFSQAIKTHNPTCLTIHGGPDTPKYSHDCEAHLRANPHIDIAVHGEGEATAAEALAALAPQIEEYGGDPKRVLDLAVLAEVPGLSFRLGDRIVHSPPRGRLENLDQIPSPFAGNLFDGLAETAAVRFAIVETNRGCPYGCTFCDWGSATASRIRKFSLDRVFAELEWCARNKLPRLAIADANFGIFERDVAIAEKIAELKEKYGYPQWFAANYAKNTIKHVRQIVSILLGAGIHTEGVLSLQSMDGDTLDAIKRSNIKLEKYDELAREFRSHDMPLFVDLMLGLPGQTLAAFREDLQQCIDREVTAKVYPTQMLVNSPMNEPAYREQFRIETDGPAATALPNANKHAMVVSTVSFTRGEYEEMLMLRRVFLLAENYGVLRQLTRFVRRETGMAEIELIDRVMRKACIAPNEFPTLTFTLLAVPDIMAPPASWALLIDELGRFVVRELGLSDDSALRTALAVQHAVLPSRDREFPHRLELAHDFAAWHSDVLDAKQQGHLRDWHEIVPRLAEYGPGNLVVSDPKGLCRTNFGFSVNGSSFNDWELESSIRRPMPGEYAVEI